MEINFHCFQLEADHILLQHCILSFFEKVCLYQYFVLYLEYLVQYVHTYSI